MISSFFSGLSKAAKFFFLVGFVIAILIALLMFSLFRGKNPTNKHDVSIAQQATKDKATVDETKKMELEMELKKLELDRQVVDRNAIEKLRAEREIVDQNKKMELEYQKEMNDKKAKADAEKAKAARAAAAAKAKAAKEKAELDLLKSLSE